MLISLLNGLDLTHWDLDTRFQNFTENISKEYSMIARKCVQGHYRKSLNVYSDYLECIVDGQNRKLYVSNSCQTGGITHTFQHNFIRLLLGFIVLLLQWRNYGHDGVSDPQPYYCLLNCLFRHKENIKAPHHWPLWGEFIGDRWITRTKE